LTTCLETNIENKAMLQVIIAELSNGNSEKENEFLGIANDLKNKELLRIIGRIENNRSD
jgi:hypothetical protein